MATVIGDLKIHLGMDLEEFKKQTKSVQILLVMAAKESYAAQKIIKKTTTGSIQGVKDQILGGINQLKWAFASFNAFPSAINMFKNMLTDKLDLVNVSSRLGLDPKSVLEWGKAVEASGGKSENLQNTLLMLSMIQSKMMLLGDDSMIPYFSALGMGVVDELGKAIPPLQLLLKMSEGFSKLAKERGKVAASNLGAMMGIDASTVSILIKGREELEKTLKIQENKNKLTTKEIEDLADIKKQYISLVDTIDSYYQKMLVTIVNGTSDAIKKFSKDWKDELKLIENGYDFLIQKAKDSWNTISSKAPDVYKWSVFGLTNIFEKWGEVLTPPKEQPNVPDRPKKGFFELDNHNDNYTAEQIELIERRNKHLSDPKSKNERSLLPGQYYIPPNSLNSVGEMIGHFLHNTATSVNSGISQAREVISYLTPYRDQKSIEEITKEAGVKPEDILDYQNKEMMMRFTNAIFSRMLPETYTKKSLEEGFSIAEKRNIVQFRKSEGGTNSTPPPPPSPRSSNEIHIGAVNLYTQATDSRGIARDFSADLSSLVTQSNLGLS